MKRGTYSGILLTLALVLVAAGSASGADICSGALRAGNIAANGQVDSYTFSAEAGNWVYINMSRESGDLTPQILLYGPDGLLDNAYGPLNASIGVQLSKSGVHTIVANSRGGSDTGEYSLSLLVMPGQTVPACESLDADGGPISSGETKLAKIDKNGDTDGYSFYGSSGDLVYINMSREAGTLTPQILLYGPDKLLASDYGSLNASIGVQLSKSGIHTIVVNSRGGTDTGDYSLGFGKTPPAQTSTFSSQDWVWLPDQNGNGSQEMAVLRRNASTGANLITILDSQTGTTIKTLNCLTTSFQGKYLALVKDLDGNGHPELAILGVRQDGKQVRVELRDALTGNLTSGLAFNPHNKFNAAYQPKELTVRENTLGNPELAVLGTNQLLGKSRVEVRDVLTGNLVKYIYLRKEF